MNICKKILSVSLASLIALSVSTVSFAATQTEETEENNTKASATVFDIDSTVKGSLSSLSDIDVFKFEVKENGAYSVKVKTEGNGTSDIYYDVIIENDITEISSFKIKGNAIETVSPDFFAEAGTYYIQLKGASVSDNSDYYINVEKIVFDNPESEPNNSSATANKIETLNDAYSKLYSGTITKDDVDYYEFSGLSGFVQYQLVNSGSVKGNYKASLVKYIGADEVVLAEIDLDDKTADISSGDVGIGLGTYYIKVSGADSTSNGSYQIRVYTKLDLSSEQEYNNTIANANPLTYGKKLYSSISTKSDIDCYKIDSAKDVTVKISYVEDSRHGPEANWKISLCSNDGTVINKAVVKKSADAEFDLREYEKGTYYVKIESGDEYTSGLYSIETKQVDPAPEETGFWDSVKSLLKKFWSDNPFDEMLKNINLLSMLKSLWDLSVGTIIKVIGSR